MESANDILGSDEVIMERADVMYGLIVNVVRERLGGAAVLWLQEHVRAPKNDKRCKLTKDQILSIRVRGKAGYPQSNLALEYGVHQSTISRVVNEK